MYDEQKSGVCDRNMNFFETARPVVQISQEVGRE